VIGAREHAPHALDRARKWPVLERRTVPERAGLPRQYRHVMPGIVGNLIAPEAAHVLADDDTVLLDHDTICVGVDIDRAADRRRGHRVLVLVEADETRLRDRGARGVEAVEPPAIAHAH